MQHARCQYTSWLCDSLSCSFVLIYFSLFSFFFNCFVVVIVARLLLSFSFCLLPHYRLMPLNIGTTINTRSQSHSLSFFFFRIKNIFFFGRKKSSKAVQSVVNRCWMTNEQNFRNRKQKQKLQLKQEKKKKLNIWFEIKEKEDSVLFVKRKKLKNKQSGRQT